MSDFDKIMKLAMQDPIAASEAISQLADPVVGLTKEMVNKYAPELAEYIREVNAFTVDLDIKAMKQYVEGGFSREEALNLIIVRKQTAANAVKSIQK